MKTEFINAALANPTIKAHSLNDGLEISSSDFYVAVDAGYKKVNALRLVDKYVKPSKTVATISETQIDKFFEFLEGKGYTKHTYRNVKTDDYWKTIYEVQDIQFGKVDRFHGQMYVWEPATYCRRCRIVLPLRNLTIDHQKPQTGGETEALIRIFRGLGLTVGGPRGKKNQDAVRKFAASVGGDPNPPLETIPKRYTLNVQGAVYYSVFREAKRLDALKEACMHHYLNLAPVCGSCNSSMRNYF